MGSFLHAETFNVFSSRGHPRSRMLGIHFALVCLLRVALSLRGGASAFLIYVGGNVLYYGTTFLVWGSLARFLGLFQYQAAYPILPTVHELSSVATDLQMLS